MFCFVNKKYLKGLFIMIVMATKEWITLSVKVTKDEKNIIDMICKQEGKQKNKDKIAINDLLHHLIIREIEPILNPSVLAENKGMPLIGENKFKYLPEKDNFVWQLDLGVNGSTVLGEEFSLVYLENLKQAINNAIQQKQDFHKKAKNGVVIPSKLIKYGVKKDVSN